MKKMLSVVLVVIVGGGAVAYSFWKRLTTLPEWYTAPEQASVPAIDPQDSAQVDAIAAEISRKIEAEIAQQGSAISDLELTAPEIQIQLNPQELNSIFVETLSEDSRGKTLLQAAKKINTSVKANQIEVGTVIDTAQIPTESLAPKERDVFERAVRIFPALENREVYLGLEGTLEVDNGQLKFKDDTVVRIGNVSLSVEQLAQRLGISPETARQALAVKIDQLAIRDIQVSGNEAVIRGLATEPEAAIAP